MNDELERWEVLLQELRTEFELREEELKLLHTIDLRMLEDDLSLDDTLSFITAGTKDLIKSDHTSIMLKRGQALEVAYSSDGIDKGQRMAITSSVAGKCLREKRNISISDLSVSPLRDLYVPIEGYLGDPIRSLLEVPIFIQDDPVGVICAESVRPRSFTPVHERVLEAVASQVAVAFKHVQYFKSAALFVEVDRMILLSADPQAGIQHALQRVMSELQALQRVQLSGAQILFRKGLAHLEFVHSTNSRDIGLTMPINQSICGRAVREGRTVIVNDVSKDPEYRSLLGSAIKSEIAVPIAMGDDRAVIGVLNVESEEPEAFSGFDRIVLENFADKVRILLAFAKLSTDVTTALESRHANDLLVAVGDQTANLIHRLNNSVGALRAQVLELQEFCADDRHVDDKKFLTETLDSLYELAEKTLRMPDEVTRFLGEAGNIVDVNKRIRESLEKLAVPAEVTVETRLAEHLPTIPLYSFDIVIENLISNALDAMPAGGVLSISTSIVTEAGLTGYVQLSVKDTGVGIPEEILPRVFDLKFTTKGSKGDGLGFGLWWVRNFVLRSKGEISVSSAPGEGTEFIIKIPLAAPAE